MHELSVTDSILKVVLEHAAKANASRVSVIRLRISELSDIKAEWIQHYFDYLSEDTIARGATLEITTVFPQFRCEACGELFEISLRDVGWVECPGCLSRDCTLVGGTDYMIENMEVEE